MESSYISSEKTTKKLLLIYGSFIDNLVIVDLRT